MPQNKVQTESSSPSPRDARDAAQRMLGQIHGLVWLAAEEANDWYLPEQNDSDEFELTVDDLRQAVADTHSQFGVVQAAANAGVYDQQFLKVGLAGAQGQAKSKGLWSALRKYFSVGKNTVAGTLPALTDSLKWSKTIIGSITAALSEEVKRIPGAASAAEGIGELLDVLLNAAETSEKRATTTNAPTISAKNK